MNNRMGALTLSHFHTPILWVFPKKGLVFTDIVSWLSGWVESLVPRSSVAPLAFARGKMQHKKWKIQRLKFTARWTRNSGNTFKNLLSAESLRKSATSDAKLRPQTCNQFEAPNPIEVAILVHRLLVNYKLLCHFSFGRWRTGGGAAVRQ